MKIRNSARNLIPSAIVTDCRTSNLIVSWFQDQFAQAGRGIKVNQVRISVFCVIAVNIAVRLIIS